MNRSCAGVLAVFLAACGPKMDKPKAEEVLPTDAATAKVVSGTVQKSEVGVGCWQLIADDSTRYELRTGQAPDSVLVDRRHVTVSIKARPDLMSTCQVGQIVDVVAVVH